MAAKTLAKITLFAIAGGGVNYLLGSLVHALSLPLYFDSIFTMAITATFGLPAGLLTAFVSNAALSLSNDILLPFMLCNFATALFTWLVKRKNGLRSMQGYLWVGIWSGLSNAVLGSIISVFVFGGYTKVHRIDDLVSAFAIAGQSLAGSVFLAGLVTNMVDKILSAFVAFALRRPAEKTWIGQAGSP
ncbi:MAG TPA: hypothetical protein VMV44_01525 [Rectinemataceae bacterium]|nr:hypothetical protein [Rectinemataceae bacterium]